MTSIPLEDPKVFYPSCRDDDFPSATRWLEGKVADDNIGDPKLWRIHDKLYDLSGYLAQHPGGSEFLTETQGTDITEAFESAHVDIVKTRAILAKYFVRNIDTPRRTKFTFAPDGFYSTLRERVLPILKQHGGTGPDQDILAFHSTLFVSFLSTLLVAACYSSLPLAALAGLLLGCLQGLSHNWFHKKTTWRTYCWDLSLFSSRDWRVTHHLSHHLFTGSLNDFEIYAWEPMLSHLPWAEKSTLLKVFSPLYFLLILGPLIGFYDFGIRMGRICLGNQTIRGENLLPLVELALIHTVQTNFCVVSSDDGRSSLTLWITMQVMSSCWLVWLGTFAAHHHPDIYRAGDAARDNPGLDWGVYQLDATRDIEGKSDFYWLKVSTFGDHQLHHLFPTVDHSKLPFLYPIFEKTCKEFNLDKKLTSKIHPIDMWLGSLKVLTSTTTRDQGVLTRPNPK